MNQDNDIRQRNICLVLPTYNNSQTVGKVIEELLEHTTHIIVVNDGSTDSTAKILTAYRHRLIAVISYPVNRGKGYALKLGFQQAIEKKYAYALTLDTDGQHDWSCAERLLAAARTSRDALLIGSRCRYHDDMPRPNRMANRFSNFWFYVQTGYRLPDTQSGCRLYPLERMEDMHLITNRFELEIEVLVRCAWRNIPLKAVPIAVYYAPEGKRVSHFRPCLDFLRISALNTMLTFLALVYGRPKMWLSTWKK